MKKKETIPNDLDLDQLLSMSRPRVTFKRF